MRVYVVAAGKDTPSICNKGQFVSRGKLLWDFLYGGKIVSGGFCPRWFIDMGAYSPVAFVWALIACAFDLEHFVYIYICKNS